MSKTSVFTTITPLPSGITRQSVMDTYRNHTEMIELNPLVIERFECKAPNYAPADEFHATWYTIKDKVSYLPGGLASGSVSYHACFHDLPDGLQTHVYAPLGLDIRAKWSVGGTLPGEPPQAAELGLNIPKTGLYIREDVKMKCNIMMLSFVKKTFKESHSTLVDRLVEKAHILESKVANERLQSLKAIPPGERMGDGQIFIAPPPGYQPPSHMSVYSNGSASSPLSSPGLSQASTLASQSPHMSYQSSDPRVSYYREQSANDHLTYLPDTRYDPHHHQQHQQYLGRERNSQQSQHFHGMPRPLAELPLGKERSSQQAQNYHAMSMPLAELPDERPEVPPKDNKQIFAAELPG
ncbi:hypothetical protein CC78DRAFT_246425 [Lojkania enalia]|uniref:DUF7053 domain-containing protein n=1 Tax=Lojkania enalia TaxID=147567 RepID=A0A9P4K8Y2_9PLEO|nr:hypothetical protein CC78DRAFT_246425 [Didymosphaeria enalia]